MLRLGLHKLIIGVLIASLEFETAKNVSSSKNKLKKVTSPLSSNALSLLSDKRVLCTRLTRNWISLSLWETSDTVNSS